MTLPTCEVSVQLLEPDDTPIAGANVIAHLSTIDIYDGVVVPAEVTARTNSAGVCTLQLFPNELGQTGSRYTVTIQRTGLPDERLFAVIPNLPSVDLHDCLVTRSTPSQPINGSTAFGRLLMNAQSAQAARELIGLGGVHNIYSFLTPLQQEDTRGTCSIDLTDIVHSVQSALFALYSKPTEGANIGRNAQGFKLEMNAGAYLLRYLDLWPGVTLHGDNKHETRLVQSMTANRDFLVSLARNGTATRSRTANVQLKDLSLQGNRLAVGAPMPGGGTVVAMHGASTALPSTDPDFDSSLNYNSFTMENVQIVGFSGDGVRVKQRGRLDMMGCRTQGNGGHGVNVQGPDCYLLHHASGSNGQDSIHTEDASTFRCVDGEIWGSNNDQLGYVGYSIKGARELTITGGELNAPFDIDGAQDKPSDDFYGYWAKCEIVDVNFKFRAANFIDSSTSDGQPFPVSGYGRLRGYRSAHVRGVFTPAYDRTPPGTYTYRPVHLVDTTGDCNLFLEAVNLPPLKKWVTVDGVQTLVDHPLWPCGAGANSFEDLVSNWDRAAVIAVYPEVEGEPPVIHTNRLAIYRGGRQGNQQGQSAMAGEIGETKAGNRLPANAVAVLNNQVTNVAQVTLPPGSWVLRGQVVYGGTGLSASVLGASIADAVDAFKAQDARYFSRSSIPFTGLTAAELDTRSIPGFEVDVTDPAGQTFYLNARASISAGTATAYGRIEALRTY